MALVNYAQLKAILVKSKFQKDNNAAYQTILGIIDGGKKKQDLDIETFNNIQIQFDALRAIVVWEVDTSSAPVTFELALYVFAPKMVIFKDISGNALANNITLTGTVEGVVNPVINTDYGIYRVFKSPVDGLFYQW